MSRFFVEKLEFWRRSRPLPCCFFLAVLFSVSGCSSDGDSPSNASGNGSGGGGNDIPPEDGTVIANTISVEVNALGSATPATLALSAGETAIINLTPDPGNELLHVEGCEGVITFNGYLVEGPPHDCAVYIEFGPIGERLTIDVFGDGSIESESASLCTARATCELFLPANVPTRLTATPAPGWFLSHWTGCDSIDNEVCIVDMANPEGVYPAFARNEDVTLNSDVIVLGESQIDAIWKIDSTSIVFRGDVEGLDSFEINKILVSTRGNGFARRISRIIAVNQTQVLVQTRLVSISDIIEEGTLVWQGNPTDGSELEFIPAEGVTVVENKSHTLNSSIQVETIVYDEDENLATQVDQVTLSLGIDSQFTPDFAFEKAMGGDASIRFVVGDKITASAKVDYNISLLAVQPMKLGEFRSSPIPVGPIVLLPTYELFADIGGSVDTSASVTSKFSVAGNIGIVKKSGEAWVAINTMSATSELPILDKTEGNVNAEIWTGVDVKFLIYGEEGSFVQAGPILRVKRKSSVQEIDVSCFQESAYYGAQASVSSRTDHLDWESTFPLQKLSIRQDEVLWIQDQDARCNTVVIGPPQNVYAFVDQNNHVFTQWEPPEGDPLVKYSVFRNNSLIGTVWDLEFLDDDTTDFFEHCYHVVAFDSNGRSSARSESSCTITNASTDKTSPTTPNGLSLSDISTTSLKLSWHASADDSGVVSYLVQEENRVIEKSTGTSVRITQLLPGSQYCISVVAIDRAGNRSPQSATLCGRTLLESDALWRMRIACAGYPYILQKQFELQPAQNGMVNFVGEGEDYIGLNVAYIVNGVYSDSTGYLDGRISYTFGNGFAVRVDQFSVDLAIGDTGDVGMDEIVSERLGGYGGYCPTIVRFDLLPIIQPNRPDISLRKEH